MDLGATHEHDERRGGESGALPGTASAAPGSARHAPPGLVQRLAESGPRAAGARGWMAVHRAIGNRAVARLLGPSGGRGGGGSAAGAVGGLMPGVEPGDDGVTVGGLGQGAATLQRVLPDAAPVATPAPAVTAWSTTNSGPDWRDHGHFDWRVGLHTTGKSGWLVQEIVNTFSGTDSAGTALTATDAGIVPRYWEAWAVDASSTVTPAVGPNNDYWIRAGRGAGSKGSWSMEGNVHWTTTDPATQGFTKGGVSNAGILLSTTSKPAGLGYVLLARTANGTWDSTGATPTHAGKAGP